jgi:hypothetical protein
MLATQPIEHLPRGLGTTGFDIGQAALNALDGLDSIHERLVGLRILYDQFRLPVDGQHQGMTCLSETIQQIDRVALEVTERPNVVGEIEHE